MTSACLDAGLSFGCAVAFLIVLAALHWLKPELDPSWHMISEYAIGSHGWMMRLGLICLSVSCFGLSLVLIKNNVTPEGLLLSVISIGPAGSAIFRTDPITAPWGQISFIGRLHAAFAALFVTAFPIVITVVTSKAIRVLSPTPVWLLWASLLVWMGLATFVGSIFYYGAMKRGFGPHAHIGWSNRFMMATYSAWLMIAVFKLCEASAGT